MLNCAECVGVCCVTGGAVTVTQEDKQRLAAHLGLELQTFEPRYVTIENGNEIIKAHLQPCPFLRGGSCSVHEARPQVCRDYFCWDRRDLSYFVARQLYVQGVREGRVRMEQRDGQVSVWVTDEPAAAA